MKMTKRGLAVLLALCMIFCFAVCAMAEDITEEQTEVSSEIEEQTEVSTPAEEAPEAPADEEEAEEAEALPEDELVVIEDEETPLGLGGNTASALPGAGNSVPGAQAPFTANVRVKMVGGPEIYFGDTVTLAAVVDGASAEYTIRWEYSDGGAWTACGTGETYTFVVDATNALYTFRAVAVEKIADAA